MRLIIDTNVLFTYFWKNSVFRDILLNQDLEFYSPEYALEELNKYSNIIRKKAKITPAQYKNILSELIEKIYFISVKDYKEGLKETYKEIKDKNKEIIDDIDFLALAHALQCPLWSNDKLLKTQEIIVVVSTDEIIQLL